MRPRHIDTVDVSQLRPSDDFELDQHRKAAFDNIFDQRGWGTNPTVSFSASGRAVSIRCMHCFVALQTTVTCIAYRITTVPLLFITDSHAMSNIRQSVSG